MRDRPSLGLDPLTPTLRDPRRWLWLAPILLALFAFRSAPRFEFAADARMLILENGYLHDQGAWQQVVHDYFWSTSGSIIPYWRPWTKLSWWLEWRAFGPSAPSFLWVSVAWHCLGVAGLWRLALDLGLRWRGALVVATLFALHPVTVEPVSMIMARSDVVAGACTIWSVIAYRRWIQAKTHRAAWLAVNLTATLLALASKEVAATIPLILASFALLEIDPAIPLRARASRLLTSLAPTLALTVLYLLVRRHLLALEHPDLPKTSLDFHPLRPLASLALYAQGAFPLSWSSVVRDLPITEAKSAWFVARGLVTWLVFGFAIAIGLRRDRRLLPLLAWAVLGLLPVVLTREISVPVGAEKLPLADRWLYAALAPILLAWTLSIAAWFSTPGRQYLIALTVAGWSLYLLDRSSEDRLRLSSELAMLDDEDRIFALIPSAYRTYEDHCRREERSVARALMKNDPALAYAASSDALAICGRTPERVADLLDAAIRTQRWIEAAGLADEAIAHPPRDPRGNRRLTFDIGTALVVAGRGVEGERWLSKSVELGTAMCALPWVPMAESARARGDVSGAAGRLEHAYECGGKRDASLLIAAATWLAGAHEEAHARALLAIASRHTLTPDQAAQATVIAKAIGQ